jgi:exopolysaccharide biosynthesis polyprenyl glycosylphosphotransferase
MTHFRRRALFVAFQIFDLLIAVFAFAAANLSVLFNQGVLSFTEFFSMRVKLSNALMFCFLLWVWHLTLASFGLYQSRRLTSRRSEIADVLKAVALGTVAFCVVGAIFHIQMMTPAFAITFWIIASVCAAGSRGFLKFLLERVRLHGRNLRYVLVVGTNQRAVEFAQKLQARPELGYRVIGFADADWAGAAVRPGQDGDVVCDLNRFADFIRSSIVDEVIIALPIRSLHSVAARIASLCEEQGIVVRFLGDIFDLKLARSQAEEYEGECVISLYTGTSDGWPLVIKRTFDFVAALVLLVILSPLFVIVALLIYATSPGSPFFVQQRVGLNKRRFPMIKFRTMVTNAEAKMAELEAMNEVSGPVFKIKNDPRVTSVGRFLRKTSIDELPQLFNVLRGDMSLVGPRPLPVRDYQGFDQDWQRRRFSVRPGMTCLWQIGGRSDVSFNQWMQLDLQYIDKWSLWLDLKILLLTIPAVLKGSGAV